MGYRIVLLKYIVKISKLIKYFQIPMEVHAGTNHVYFEGNSKVVSKHWSPIM